MLFLLLVLVPVWANNVRFYRKTDLNEIKNISEPLFISPESRHLLSTAADGKPTEIFVYAQLNENLTVLQDNSLVSTVGWRTYGFVSPTFYFFHNQSGTFRFEDGNEIRLSFDSSIFGYDSKTRSIVYAKFGRDVRRLKKGMDVLLFNLPCRITALQTFEDLILSLCSEGDVFLDQDFLVSLDPSTVEVPFFATHTKIVPPETYFIFLLGAILAAVFSYFLKRYREKRIQSACCNKLENLVYA